LGSKLSSTKLNSTRVLKLKFALGSHLTLSSLKHFPTLLFETSSLSQFAGWTCFI